MFPTIIIVVFAIAIAVASSAAQLKTKKGKPQSLQQKAKTHSADTVRANVGRPADRNSKANVDRPRSVTKKDTRTYRALEDRENDWLARQRREEAANEKRFSAMYGLKRSHEAECDARRLIIEHYNECDADGIDTGMVQ